MSEPRSKQSVPAPYERHSLRIAAAAQEGSPSPGARIPDGVIVDGLVLGGKTIEEAGPLVRAMAERKLLVPITVRAGGRSVRRTAGELGATCDAEAALAACVAEEDAGLLRRIAAWITSGGERRVPLPVRLDRNACEERLLRLTRDWMQPPREPRLKWVGERIERIPGKPGFEVDAEGSCARVEAVLASSEWQEAVARSVGEGETLEAWLKQGTPLAVDLAVVAKPPRVTAAHLDAIRMELSRFSTRFRTGERNRAHNIRLASRAIDGLVLLPGDTFSYNDTVGPRTRRAGFRLAPQIVDGELVPGIGGGVCQVSTTLYNAALLADMEIVRRRHHQFPVHYVPAGRDATVAYGSLDLQFRNRFQKPVALHVTTQGSRLLVRVYGAPECRREVKLLRTGIRRLPAGVVRVSGSGRAGKARTPRSGHRVTLIRVVRDPSGVERRETISCDVYPPQHAVIYSESRRRRPPSRGSQAPEVAAEVRAETGGG
jgi:vancomycin resistance protein YoaR